MNTNAEMSAGIPDCADAVDAATAQTRTPGNQQTENPTASAIPAVPAEKPKIPASLSQPQKGRDLRGGGYSSPEAELQVLGCIVHDPDYAFGLLKEEGVGGTHFFDLRYRKIFRLLEQMHREGERMDCATIYARGKAKGMAGTPEEVVLLSTLEDTVPSALSLPAFLPELKDLHDRRQAVDVAYRLIKIAEDRTAPAHLLLEDSENVLRQLRRNSSPVRLTIRTAAHLVDKPVVENDNILADRLLAKGQSFTLLGAGGLGKSRLLLQLAACCITGRSFLDLRTHCPDLRWLIFQAENSNRRLRDDLARLRAWLGEDWDRVASRLLIHTIEEGSDAFVQLDAPGVRHKLSDIIEEHEPDVVCFDPLNCFGVGDLNRDSDMRETCQSLTHLCHESRADRAIVVLHHALTGKAGAARATGFDRSSFGRNSKLLHAWTRGQMNIAPGGSRDNRKLIVSCGKCSNGEEFEPYGVVLNPDTMIYEVDRDFNVDSWEKEIVEGKRSDPEDSLVEICLRPLSRGEAVKQLIQKGFSRATAYRAIQSALEQGMIRLEGEQLCPVELK